jgi:Integrase zinc binding domain
MERTNTQKVTSNRLARWWEIFSEYNVEFVYIEGQHNIVTDALSHNPINTEEQVNASMEEACLRFDYTGDQEFEKAYNLCKAHNTLINGNIRFNGLTCVPKKDREKVLKACYDGKGHPRGNKLAERVATRFHWDNLWADCKKYAETCQQCQANKTERKWLMDLLHPLPVLARPWEHVTTDFFFNLPTAQEGYNRVWLVVDHFSKMVKLIPLTNKIITEKTVKLYFQHVYCNYGLPKTIVSDQDTWFNSNFWQALWKLTGTTLHMTAARHQQTDEQSKRTIQTIKQTIRMYLNKTGTNWLQWIPMAEFWYNFATHTSTGKSPFKVVQGCNPRNPIDAALQIDKTIGNTKAMELINEVLRSQALWKYTNSKMKWKERDNTTIKEEKEVRRKIKESQQRFKLYYDKKHRPHNIKTNDWVRVSKKGFRNGFFPDNRKAMLNTKYSHPVKILQVINGTTIL